MGWSHCNQNQRMQQSQIAKKINACDNLKLKSELFTISRAYFCFCSILWCQSTCQHFPQLSLTVQPTGDCVWFSILMQCRSFTNFIGRLNIYSKHMKTYERQKKQFRNKFFPQPFLLFSTVTKPRTPEPAPREANGRAANPLLAVSA